jgi:erythromycin esterase-like protein
MMLENDLDTLPTLIAQSVEPLPDFDDEHFGALFDRFADARVVCLGEASHGTSEFYRARAAISRRLIERHGFNIVALEADWPDSAVLDRYVRNRASGAGEENAFERFPTWMWRNREFDTFVRWLHGRNASLPYGRMCGLYGLDLYNLSAAMQAVIGFLRKEDPELGRLAHRRYGCLEPWAESPEIYGRHSLLEGYARCEVGVTQMLKDLLQRQVDCFGEECEDWLDAAANARLVKDAEAYYRIMYHGSVESWNLRDTHMFDTLNMILEAKGPNSKAIVWAHNSHVGNAAYTDMGMRRGELNVGQLAKEKWDARARLIGLGTHTGTVAAADDWDEPMKVKQVRPSLRDSHERMSHDSGVPRFLLDLREEEVGPNLKEELGEPRLERFIGVIYRPETERWSHYSEAILPRQFDAWLWFDETTAVNPLPGQMRPGGAAGTDDTYPFGL